MTAGLQGGDVATLLGLKPPDVSKRLSGSVKWTQAERDTLQAALAWKGHGLFKP